ncbi:hypothetical protein D3C76_1162590 [compost metagenome]
MVAMRQTDHASRAAALRLTNLANSDDTFISSNMSRLLFSFSPSVPKPTATPAASIFSTGAAPEASFILLTGLCATPTLRSAIKAISASSTQTQ